MDRTSVGDTIRKLRRDGRTILTEVESKDLLSAAGIPVIPTELAADRSAAVALARRLGQPVALKVISPDIVHKSDSGGVRLGLTTPEEVAVAYDSIIALTKQAQPAAAIHGVSVQPMANPGIEVIVGARRDRQFGHLVLFGLGGVFVEVLKDVSFRIIPLAERDARAMIREIRGLPLLLGYRGHPPANMVALEHLIVNISNLVSEHPEIAEIDLNPVFASADGAIAVDARIMLASAEVALAPSEDCLPNVVEKLERVFNARTVALIGDERGYGYAWSSRIKVMATFKGEVYLVQTDGQQLPWMGDQGMRRVESLSQIPEPIDYVIAGVPAEEGPALVAQCVQNRVGGVAFLTPGFAETDTVAGISYQNEMALTARQGALSLIGPNCWGIYNPKTGLRQNGQQSCGETGSVGFISQSGEFCTRFGTLGVDHGIKISKSIGSGNNTVLECTDYLEYFASDADTKIIGMHIEGVKDGSRFFHCLKDVARKKPVVVWKLGQTEEGARAAASHTAALAQSSEVWPFLLRQCGAIGVGSLDEMIDTVKALLYLRANEGKRIGLITTSGGDMVATTEAFAGEGFTFPRLQEESRRSAASLILVGCKDNPFDMSSNFMLDPDPAPSLRAGLDIMDQDDNVDWIVLDFYAQIFRLRGTPDVEIPEVTVQFLSQFHQRAKKPLVVILTAALDDNVIAETRKRLVSAGIPVFGRYAAAKAVGNVVAYQSFLNHL